MNSERIKEAIKAHTHGYTIEQIADILGEDTETITHILVDSAADIEDERAYRNELTPAKRAGLMRSAAKTVSASGKIYYGIDISVWNGSVDMNKVKASGKSFVFIRSGYGNVSAYPNQVDSRFAENVKKARAAGLDFGVYHYCYATTPEAARTEAQGFVKQLNSIKPIPHLVLLDIEESSQYNLPSATIGKICSAFMSVVEAAGYFGALYSYEAFFKKMSAADREPYAIWCANICSKPSIKYDGWQYSFTGRVNGISGDVDLDQTTKDFPSIIKTVGRNGYAAESKSSTKTLDTTGFKKGDKSLGVYFLKRELIASGYKLDDNDVFGNGTEKAVNSILDKSGYTQNGIAGKNFAKMFIK